MPAEENKAMVKRLFDEVVSRGNFAIAEELLSADYANHDMPPAAPGSERFKQLIGMVRTAFPDMQVVQEDMVADGDRVATRGYFTGTHQGDFMGIAATGKSINVKFQDLWRVENGKLRENWVVLDIA